MSYQTQALWVRVPLPSQIHSSKVTHTMCGAVARIADAQGVPEDQLRRAGYWERGSMSTDYLSQLPREFMRVIAGFSRLPGNYHLRRAAVQPPKSLKRLICPWVDSWLARYDTCIMSGLSFTGGGLDDCDLAGKSFLELLEISCCKTLLSYNISFLFSRCGPTLFSVTLIGADSPTMFW